MWFFKFLILFIATIAGIKNCSVPLSSDQRMSLKVSCDEIVAKALFLARFLRSGAPIDLSFAHLAAPFDVPSDQANSLL